MQEKTLHHAVQEIRLVDAMKHRNRKPIDAKCRECGHIQSVRDGDFILAASPRCLACGGMLDRISVPRKTYHAGTFKAGHASLHGKDSIGDGKPQNSGENGTADKPRCGNPVTHT